MNEKLLTVNKSTRAAFNPINPRSISACRRYFEAGIAGRECITLLQQAQMMEAKVGRDIFGLEDDKISIYSILPKMHFGLTERNIIYIKNWNELTYTDKQMLEAFFDYRGVALPGKSADFIQDQLPKGRQERRMFETFNMSHGLNIKITPEGRVFLSNIDSLDSNTRKILEFYFTPDGYAKMYFQNGFLTRLGLSLREHNPSKLKTREQLFSLYEKIERKDRTSERCKEILLKKNPSIKTDIERMHPIIANALTNRYLLYSKFAPFVNEDLLFIGTSSYADEIFKLQERFDTKSKVLAATYYNGMNVGIAIADELCTDINKLQEFLDKASRLHWIPEGCNNPEYIAAHEFSHSLIHIYDLSRDPILRDIEEEVLHSGKIETELSLQANMNSKEFIAEAWSEYAISKNPRETAMKVGNRIINFLQKEVIIL
jgi:hypothetical protein